MWKDDLSSVSIIVLSKEGRRLLMCAIILDIDLDFCNPQNKLSSSFTKNKTPTEILDWIIEQTSPKIKIVMAIQHHEAFGIWRGMVDNKMLAKPHHIIHIDEHHDLYHDYHLDCGSFLKYALEEWPRCKANWVIPFNRTGLIGHTYYRGYRGSPLEKRFSITTRMPVSEMRKTKLISLTASPDYTKPEILYDLLDFIETNYANRIIGQFPDFRKKLHKKRPQHKTLPNDWTMRSVKKCA